MLVLASNSPRRRALLALLGVPFAVCPAEVDETPLPGEHPAAYVKRLACTKAKQAWVRWGGEAFLLGADTTVALEEEAGRWEILGKPKDAQQAEWMLRRLRGRTHSVFTGLALLHKPSGNLWSDVCVSEVPIRNFSDEEMQAYIASGDPFDKAGAYAIQHREFHPVENFVGCFANVMGLPLCHVAHLFDRAGIHLPRQGLPSCVQSFGGPCAVGAPVENE